MTVAMTAEAFPSPKRSRAGIRYTNTGMVCIVSRMGRTMRLARGELEISIPIGSPRRRASTTLASTMERVSIISSQNPTMPTRLRIAAYRTPVRSLPFARHPARNTRIRNKNQGMCSNSHLNPLTIPPSRAWIFSRTGSAETAKWRTALSMASVLGLCTKGNPLSQSVPFLFAPF